MKTTPEPHLHLGRYRLLKEADENETAALHRPNTDLGQWCLAQCQNADTPCAKIVFDYSAHQGGKISILAQNQGKSGWLLVEKLNIHSQADTFETLLFTAKNDDGAWLDDDFCQKLLLLGAVQNGEAETIPKDMEESDKLQRDSFFTRYQEENNQYYKNRVLQFDRWADDQKAALGNELEAVKTEIKAAKRERDLAQNTAELSEHEDNIRKLEQKKRRLRNSLDDKEDEIDAKHDELVKELRRQTAFECRHETLFAVKWQII